MRVKGGMKVQKNNNRDLDSKKSGDGIKRRLKNTGLAIAALTALYAGPANADNIRTAVQEGTPAALKYETGFDRLVLQGEFKYGIPERYDTEYFGGIGRKLNDGYAIKKLEILAKVDPRKTKMWKNLTAKERARLTKCLGYAVRMTDCNDDIWYQSLTNKTLGKDQYGRDWEVTDFIDQLDRHGKAFWWMYEDKADKNTDRFLDKGETKALMALIDVDKNGFISHQEIDNYASDVERRNKVRLHNVVVEEHFFEKELKYKIVNLGSKLDPNGLSKEADRLLNGRDLVTGRWLADKQGHVSKGYFQVLFEDRAKRRGLDVQKDNRGLIGYQVISDDYKIGVKRIFDDGRRDVPIKFADKKVRDVVEKHMRGLKLGIELADINGNGHVDKSEFSKMKEYDLDSNGTIDQQELAEELAKRIRSKSKD